MVFSSDVETGFNVAEVLIGHAGCDGVQEFVHVVRDFLRLHPEVQDSQKAQGLIGDELLW